MIVDDPLNPAVMNDVNVFVNVRESETVACQLTLLLQQVKVTAHLMKSIQTFVASYIYARVSKDKRVSSDLLEEVYLVA